MALYYLQRASVIAISTSLLIAGCGQNIETERTAAVPAGAIQVEDQLFMVPIGTDEAGCATYQAYSPSMAVVQVIHYRRQNGSFTHDREQAGCPAIKTDGDSEQPQ